ncbi:FAD-binding and (Fe-S)-binding domain-containing protein [Rubrimonas cliftonensis]|uniref:FAD-binding and (Fe-S)-binding domain-containing protein n=1 Tax=Rubrimonas cliftonensis TaxID=89524 RepID=UPI0031836C86
MNGAAMAGGRFSGLAGAIQGEVLEGAFDRGRYATDASFYQITPEAVVVPRRFEDVEATLAAARAEGASLTGRGGGTSQAGQTVAPGVVIDFSTHLNGLRHLDVEGRRAVVEPGLVLDELNRMLKPHGLWFPVDVSTASRATIGGMTANNSCGSRSLRYGRMRENVIAVEALLADGARARFGEIDARKSLEMGANDPVSTLFRDMLALGAREAEEIAARFPRVQRRVGGYNIDALTPNGPTNNLAHLLVGSEGTLALFETIEIKLSPLPGPKALGVCHFPTFRAAMDAAQHLVALGPTAVELVDRTMIELGRDIPIFRPVMESFVRGDPAALLLVEFAETPDENRRRLDALHETMADLGFRWGDAAKQEGGVVEAIDPAFQARIWGVRTQGLNIMMSMRSEGKPVSFVEDCAVELKDLGDFTDRLTAVFRKHGTDGTWYAHASVGLLHVRPVLNLKEELGVKALRAIAEEAFDLVAEYKGSHSGEHGDGLVRSEFHEKMFGVRMVRSFEAVKDRFDPEGRLNPGKIVRAPKMDDRSLFRWPEGYAAEKRETAFRWDDWPGGLIGAVEMCNNNGACRKLSGGAMCPSYRATRNERDLTRGRANTLRLALTGQLGPDAFASDAMAETMSLCVSCKACQRECPMSVDMAKMKIEVQAARMAKHGPSLRDRLVAHLPRYAPWAARAPWLMNLRNRVPALRRLSERVAGFAADRPLPEWRAPFREPADDAEPEVMLLADTFNRHFDPDILRDAVFVLKAAGLRVGFARAPKGRPLCCGRTWLSAGLVAEAKAEMARTAAVLRPVLERGGAVAGLEPSCLLTFRDEAPRLLDDWPMELGRRVMLLEEFLAPLADRLPLKRLEGRALVHGHCHQKAADVMGPVETLLRAVPGLDVGVIDSSCCGMAGAFGYQAETAAVSRAMGELALAPAVRAAPDATIVADGTSCRHQIADLAGREAVHVATVLRRSLEAAE